MSAEPAVAICPREVSMHIEERVTVPEGTPEFEWLLGRPVQKAMPRYDHALTQRLVAEAVGAWASARACGRVGTEWRFFVRPLGEAERPLTPDVAYVSYERLPRAARAQAQEPSMAPEVAIEVRSPSDRELFVAHKVDVYLRAGTALVVVVDPHTRVTIAHDPEHQGVFGPRDVFTHVAMPEFALDLGVLFAELDR